MSSPLILVTSDYKLHRQAFTYAIEQLRPDYNVREVIPEAMDGTVRSERPWLVICSTVTPTIAEMVPAWILLPLEGHESASVSVFGSRRDMATPPFEEVVSIIDDLWVTVAPLPQH